MFDNDELVYVWTIIHGLDHQHPACGPGCLQKRVSKKLLSKLEERKPDLRSVHPTEENDG